MIARIRMPSVVSVLTLTLVYIFGFGFLGLGFPSACAASLTCDNIPDTLAGTLPLRPRTLPPGPPPPPHLRRHSTSTVLWCSAATTSYLYIKSRSPIPPATVLDTLNMALQHVATQIHEGGDRSIANGSFIWRGLNGCRLVAVSGGGIRMTWGEMEDAIVLLLEYMGVYGAGGVDFVLYDGATEVAMASLT